MQFHNLADIVESSIEGGCRLSIEGGCLLSSGSSWYNI